jgi:hypothetical protein
LRTYRFGAICKDERRDFKVGSERLSMAMMSFVFISLVLYASIALGWGLYTALTAILGTLAFGVVLIAMHVMSSQMFAYLIILLWILSIIVLIVRGGGSALLAIYGSAFAIVFGGVLSYRALQAAARLPLFIPVALIIVLAPLLTQDPSKLASSAGVHLAALALLTITPLMVLLTIRLARVSIVDVISEASAEVEAEPLIVAKEAARIASTMTTRGETAELNPEQLANCITSAYKDGFRDIQLDTIIAAAGKRFKVTLVIRLIMLVIGVGTATYVLVYLLAWAALPINVAELWSGHSIPIQDISLFGKLLHLPLGPYLQVSTLLTTVAVAGFLAFASTEDPYGDAIHNSIVRRPARFSVMLALPYLYIVTTDRVPRGDSAT